MNINRNNYEEYFILYMDNELGSVDRRMVEAFIQQHPDLKEELDALVQYKFVPDTGIVFDRKEELMKVSNDTSITLSNYDEWLVLYMDNELTAGQKTTLEQFISANPLVKEELALLQRTKLQPEEIVFRDKASLYRTEEKVRRIPVRWWRIAAAAVLLIGISITTAVIINNRPSAGKTEIVKGRVEEKTNPVITPVVTNKEEHPTVNETAVIKDIKRSFSPDQKQSANKDLVVKENNNVVKKPAPVVIQPQPKKEEPVIVTTNKPSNDLPVPYKSIAKEDPVKENKEQNSVVTTNTPPSSDKMMYTSYEPDELDQPDGKKNKNRGLFRKIARTFEKRAGIDPTDDNKLLVAGLAIKLK